METRASTTFSSSTERNQAHTIVSNLPYYAISTLRGCGCGDILPYLFYKAGMLLIFTTTAHIWMLIVFCELPKTPGKTIKQGRVVGKNISAPCPEVRTSRLSPSIISTKDFTVLLVGIQYLIIARWPVIGATWPAQNRPTPLYRSHCSNLIGQFQP